MKHKKKKKGINPSAMRCQYCGGTVVLRSADGIYHENHSHTMLYVCSNYPRCDAYVRTHPGTNIPVGTLANRELRTLRNQAHHYFDQLYLSGLMSKQDAYLWLAGTAFQSAHWLSRRILLQRGHRRKQEAPGASQETTAVRISPMQRRRSIMTLTQPQQRKVEQNLGLVGKVIKDKVHNPGQNSIYSYDDLYQIGCIGLCKAAYSDKGGCFSTYAYRLIWNEICTALIYANRRAAKECELLPEVLGKEDSLDEHHELSMILDRLEANASEAMAKGIRAIRLSAEGYSHAEIGSILGESDKCVAARISRTRKYLRSHPDLAAF